MPAGSAPAPAPEHTYALKKFHHFNRNDVEITCFCSFDRNWHLQRCVRVLKGHVQEERFGRVVGEDSIHHVIVVNVPAQELVNIKACCPWLAGPCIYGVDPSLDRAHALFWVSM